MDEILNNKELNNFLESLNLTSKQIELTKEIAIILVPLLITALLFFFTGWFFRTMKKRKVIVNELKENTIEESSPIPTNIKELEDYKEKFIELYNLTQGKKVKRNNSFESIENENSSSTDQDDLTKIKGINSKIQYILRINQINSFEKVAETPTETLQFLLDKYGGSAYKIYNPISWNLQANLIIEKNFKELEKIQQLID